MSNSDLLKLYQKLFLIRLTEETIAERYKEQKMRCPTHLSTGQEAIAVGVCENLGPNDLVYSNHRCHAHYLAKGGDLKKMLAELYGKATGCSGGRGGSMHLIDLQAGFGGATPIVGNSLAVAVGAAFAKKYKKEKGVVVVFIGEATTEEGVYHECLNFASLHQLPILFVCENNIYSVYTHLRERQSPQRNMVKIAAANGLITNKSDGIDPVEVFLTTKKFMPRVRGRQPVYLEFTTYRWREHCGPSYDDNLGYRPAEEIKQWWRDSVKLMEEKYLADQSLAAIKRQTKKKIDEAFLFAEKSRFPKKANLYEHLYQ